MWSNFVYICRRSVKRLRQKIGRLVTYSVQNVRRGRASFFSTLVIVVAMLFVCNIVFSLYLIGQDLLIYLHKKADLYVEIVDSVDDFTIQAFISDLEDLDGVNEVIYISKSDALEQFQVSFPESELMSFLTRYNEPNPLPASIGVVTDDLVFQKDVFAFLRQKKYEGLIDFNSVSSQTEQVRRNANFLQFTNFLRVTSAVLIGIFLVSTLLIVYNTVLSNLRRRKDEIEIMSLVGARKSMIEGPFFLEGAIMMFVAVFCANLMLYFFLGRLQSAGILLFENIQVNDYFFSSILFIEQNMSSFFLAELLVMLILGYFTCKIAMYRYFNKVAATV